jgi:TATA-box binding protein (TBP) (component of TFIID and TFIIIB)
LLKLFKHKEKTYKELSMSLCKICDPKNKFKSCICAENFLTFNETCKKIVDNFYNYENFSLIKNWTISTITVCCNFNSRIDIKKYTDIYGSNCLKKQFYNCVHVYIGVKYQDKIKISVKIFSNGKIQMAGVLNVYSITYAIRKMFKRLTILKAFQENAFISNVKICMINSDFKINKNIKQSGLCKIFDEKNLSYIKRYSFNPNKYPAINVKILNSDNTSLTTCLIFRSGSIMITGGNNIYDYLNIYENILKIIEENHSLILI